MGNPDGNNMVQILGLSKTELSMILGSTLDTPFYERTYTELDAQNSTLQSHKGVLYKLHDISDWGELEESEDGHKGVPYKLHDISNWGEPEESEDGHRGVLYKLHDNSEWGELKKSKDLSKCTEFLKQKILFIERAFTQLYIIRSWPNG